MHSICILKVNKFCVILRPIVCHLKVSTISSQGQYHLIFRSRCHVFLFAFQEQAIRKTASSPDFENSDLPAPTSRDKIEPLPVFTSMSSATDSHVTSSHDQSSSSETSLSTATTSTIGANQKQHTPDDPDDPNNAAVQSQSETHLLVSGGKLRTSQAEKPASSLTMVTKASATPLTTVTKASSVTVMENRSVKISTKHDDDNDDTVHSAPASPPLTSSRNSATSLQAVAKSGADSGAVSPASGSAAHLQRPRGYTLSSLNDEQRGEEQRCMIATVVTSGSSVRHCVCAICIVYYIEIDST